MYKTIEALDSALDILKIYDFNIVSKDHPSHRIYHWSIFLFNSIIDVGLYNKNYIISWLLSSAQCKLIDLHDCKTIKIKFKKNCHYKIFFLQWQTTVTVTHENIALIYLKRIYWIIRHINSSFHFEHHCYPQHTRKTLKYIYLSISRVCAIFQKLLNGHSISVHDLHGTSYNSPVHLMKPHNLIVCYCYLCKY